VIILSLPPIPYGKHIWPKFKRDQINSSFYASSVITNISMVFAGYDTGSNVCYIYNMDTSGNMLWRTQLPNGTLPFDLSMDDNYIYVPSNTGMLYALKIRDGSIVWEYSAPGQISPVVIDQDDILYFSVTGNSTGYVYSLAPDGSFRWSYQTPTNYGVADDCAPLIDVYGNIYIELGSIYINARSIVQFSQDGNVNWISQPFAEVTQSAGYYQQLCCNMYGTIMFCDTEATITAFDPNGNAIWSYGGSLDNHFEVMSISNSGSIVYVYTPITYQIFGVNASNGSQVFVVSPPGGGLNSPPGVPAGSFIDDVLFWTTVDGIYAMDTSGNSTQINSIRGYYNLSVDPNNNIYIPAKNVMYVTNANGQTLFQYTDPDISSITGALTAPIVLSPPSSKNILPCYRCCNGMISSRMKYN